MELNNFTAEDIVNIRKLLNRATVKGIGEAKVLAVLDEKLKAAQIQLNMEQAADGEDVSGTD